MNIRWRLLPVAFFRVVSLPFQIPIEAMMRIAIRIWKIFREILEDIQKIEWINNYDDALEEAKKSNRFILAAFTAPGNPFSIQSKRLLKEVFEKFDFLFWVFSKDLVLLQISPLNIIQWIEYTQQYQVGKIPTVLCLDSNGVEQGRVVGYTPGTGVQAWIQSFEEASSINSISIDDISTEQDEKVYQTVAASV